MSFDKIGLSEKEKKQGKKQGPIGRNVSSIALGENGLLSLNQPDERHQFPPSPRLAHKECSQTDFFPFTHKGQVASDKNASRLANGFVGLSNADQAQDFDPLKPHAMSRLRIAHDASEIPTKGPRQVPVGAALRTGRFSAPSRRRDGRAVKLLAGSIASVEDAGPGSALLRRCPRWRWPSAQTLLLPSLAHHHNAAAVATTHFQLKQLHERQHAGGRGVAVDLPEPVPVRRVWARVAQVDATGTRPGRSPHHVAGQRRRQRRAHLAHDCAAFGRGDGQAVAAGGAACRKASGRRRRRRCAGKRLDLD